MTSIDTTDHDDWLAGVRHRLLAVRDEYAARLLELTGQTPDAANTDIYAATIATTRQSLADTTAALLRIEASRYGMCETCGGEIPPERLDILPQARHCVACVSRRR